MKSYITMLAMLLSGSMALAQNTDPTVMTIAGQPVSRSEFEYSYNKNNSDGVIDKKSVKEYVDLFVNYKLKVKAAMDARLDTLTSFKKEFLEYRDQQIRPTYVTEADVEAKAREIYKQEQLRVDKSGGLVETAHILLRVSQKASQAEQDKAKLRADSVYNALLKGADFAELAKKLSDDKASAVKGGVLPPIERARVVKAYADVAFAMNPGETSKPFLSDFGYHIVRLDKKTTFEIAYPYDSVKTNIHRFIEARNLRDQIAGEKIKQLADAKGILPQALIDAKADSMAAADPQLRYLIQEYHDGLLLYEASNREVWQKAAADSTGQALYYKKNRKHYRFDSPRYKGIAYFCKQQSDVQAVQAALKGKPFDEWAKILRTTFNNDSVLRIRVEKGLFKEGQSALVDRNVFKKDTSVVAPKGFPFQATYGKLLKRDPESIDDVRAQVLADYQDSLEKAWVDALRKKYKVSVDEKALATVNHH